eukprot:TRINITY_DN7617_c1_g1_i1.p1 TRINITY_DN7617_c1_g1~~TRINITY_DN7617_c1_g1_i1.p1  ORF type:complete len:413 (-),score=91.49 TRINITY_DN7617_c1_g1_i1:64-1302(-)
MGRLRRREVLGSLIAVVLLWCTTISYLVLDVCGTDYTKVFIYDGCIGSGTVTVFIFCMLEVIVGCWFLQRFFLPAFFRDTWDTFDELKKQKLVGFIAQIVVRSACFLQLLHILVAMWGENFSREEGLFGKYNAKTAYAKLVHEHMPTTCAAAGMDDAVVLAMRRWVFAKYHMVAVHIWELAFIPGLTIDGWLHHLFVVLVAAIGSQPQTVVGRPELQPIIDGCGFCFIMGASCNALVKSCVVMYHYTAPNYLTQARWMNASIAGALIIQIVYYTMLPLWIAFRHASLLGPQVLVFVVILPVAFLAVVEVRLILVKQSIVRNAYRKHRAAQASGMSSLSLAAADTTASAPTTSSFEAAFPPRLLSGASGGHRGAAEARSAASSFKAGRSPSPGTSFNAARLDSVDDGWKESQC